MPKLRCAVAAVLLFLLLAGAARAAPEQYVVVIQGVPAGAMSVERDADGLVRVDYTYRDNGRGPDMKEEYRVGEAQRVSAYKVRGKSTFGGEIREDFAFADGRVRAGPGALNLRHHCGPDDRGRAQP